MDHHGFHDQRLIGRAASLPQNVFNTMTCTALRQSTSCLQAYKSTYMRCRSQLLSGPEPTHLHYSFALLGTLYMLSDSRQQCEGLCCVCA